MENNSAVHFEATMKRMTVLIPSHCFKNPNLGTRRYDNVIALPRQKNF